MPALDTTPEAAAMQAEIHRRLGSRGRFLLAVEMSEMVRELARAGIRARHPEMDEVEVTAALLRQLYGAAPELR